MKFLRATPQGYLKLLLELMVIFLSVVLAFFFDDYRESTNERNQYKSDLSTFRSELIGEINNLAIKLDSFRVLNDPPYRGQRFKELSDLIWIDSLVEIKKATMRDMRYIIESYYIFPFVSDVNLSPLAHEIRVNYSSHFTEGNVLKWLTIYEEEMLTLRKVRESISEESKKLIMFIHKTSPSLEFDKQDSVFLYSKEVTWSFNYVLMMQKESYNYEKYLAQKRFVDVLAFLDKELVALGVEIDSDSDCWAVDFKKRYKCESGRLINDSELVSIRDILVKERHDFLSRH